MRASASLALLALLAGCAGQAPPTTDEDCSLAFAAWQSASAAARDSRYRLIAGFPGLRSDRLAAALGEQAHSAEQRRLWLAQLAANDRDAQAVEQATLGSAPSAALETCRQRQQARLLTDAAAFERLRQAARVADDYRPWARWLGLYPLAAPVYRRAIAAWQAESAAARAPADGPQWLNYQPPARTAPPVAALAHDALGLPQPDAAQRQALFARHAPQLLIEQRSRADRIGSPGFAGDGRRRFADIEPRLYRQLGWSRLNGRWHLQLIYQFWFAQRPAAHPLDLYAGELDGLIWRVTLDERGGALLYDSIHPCGCWHAFFLPADSPLRLRQPAQAEARSALRLDIAGGTAPSLWLRGGDHRLLWVDGRRPARPSQTYGFAALDELRSLPHPQGRRSLYDRHGLVPGSERLERWLLWPSGVRSAGAMRQWGRHATAFIGRAHFDDPDLLQQYFGFTATTAAE
ncbi:hypothetical protein [Pseudomonas sp. PL-6]